MPSPGYTRNVAKRKRKKQASAKRNAPTKRRWQRGSKYSGGELFMAGLGLMLIILVVGMVISSLFGE
jgi:hypothetical protein